MRKEIWVNSYHLRDYNSVCGNVGRRSWPTSVAALNLIRRYVHAFVGAYKRALAIQITSGCLLTRLELFLCLSFWHLVTSSQAAWQRVIIDASSWLYAMSTWLTMIYISRKYTKIILKKQLIVWFENFEDLFQFDPTLKLKKRMIYDVIKLHYI